jgi:hypothetical protein
LIEQSPAIPDTVITAFESEFKSIPNLKVPDICHGIEHTRVYDSSKPRLSKITAEAALHLKMRKKLLRDDLFPHIKQTISEELVEKIDERIKKLVPLEQPKATKEDEKKKAIDGFNDIAVNMQTDWRNLITSRRNLLAGPGESPKRAAVVAPPGYASVDGGVITTDAVNVIIGTPTHGPQPGAVDIQSIAEATGATGATAPSSEGGEEDASKFISV